MQVLTESECVEWLKSRDMSALVEQGLPCDSCLTGDYEILFQAPTDARSQQRLARDLIAWEGDFSSALFWLTDWPMYEPDEMAIIDGLRRGHGEQRELIRAPGHVFKSTERDELVGWVYLMMVFGWDGYLFASPFRGSAFQTSHEDFVRVACSDPQHFAEAQAFVHGYEVQIHRETPAT